MIPLIQNPNPSLFHWVIMGDNYNEVKYIRVTASQHVFQIKLSKEMRNVTMHVPVSLK